jgi:hypothetical protein
MKTVSLLFLPLVLSFAAPSFAQEKVYRCGNLYTNNKIEAEKPGSNCKEVTGGNVTVVQGAARAAVPPSAAGGAGVSAARSPAGSPQVTGSDQRARDGEARSVLESELKKAEERQAQLLKDYNNGEPEKEGSEGRNYQKYIDRVANMKAEIARNQSDIDGIRREIGRLPAVNR